MHHPSDRPQPFGTPGRWSIGRALILAGCLALLTAGCTTEESGGDVDGGGGGGGGGGASGTGAAQASASLLATPKAAISNQIVCLKMGDLSSLKPCFTEEVRDQLTQEMVDKAKDAIPSPIRIDDYVHDIKFKEVDGRMTAEIKKADGSTLTTMVQIDDEWFTETIWFK